MSMATAPIDSPRLRRLAQARRTRSDGRCELCGLPVAAEHRHVLDVAASELRCACPACAILFDRDEAGGGHYRGLPRRHLRIDDLDLDDVGWARLGVPVDLAFFVDGGDVTAFYPSPLGITRFSPDQEMWRELRADNPVVAGIQPEVEALLVRRSRVPAEHWIVPLDTCYRLVALVRRHWSGFTGGREVWKEIDGFFEDLRRVGRAVTNDGRRLPVDRKEAG